MIKILSSKSCSQCKIAKIILEKNNIKYEEIDAMSLEGDAIIKQYNLMKLPFIIDGDKTYDSITKLLDINNEPATDGCAECHF